MKFVILVATLLVLSTTKAALTDQQKNDLVALREHCLATTKTPLDKLIRFSQHKYDDNDDEIKQYMLCYFQTIGAIDKDGKFVVNTTHAKLEELISVEVADKVVATCLHVADSIVETAWQYAKCGHKYWPADYPPY